MICPKCNAQINDRAEFCPKCGEKVGKASSASSNTTYSTNSKNPVYTSVQLDPPEPMLRIVGGLFMLLGLMGTAANAVGIFFRCQLFEGNDENAVFFAIAACVYGIMFCLLYVYAGYKAVKQEDILSCCGWGKALMWLTIGACAFYYLSSTALKATDAVTVDLFSNIVAQVLIVWPIAFMVPMSYLSLSTKAKSKLPRN